MPRRHFVSKLDPTGQDSKLNNIASASVETPLSLPTEQSNNNTLDLGKKDKAPTNDVSVSTEKSKSSNTILAKAKTGNIELPNETSNKSYSSASTPKTSGVIFLADTLDGYETNSDDEFHGGTKESLLETLSQSTIADGVKILSQEYIKRAYEFCKATKVEDSTVTERPTSNKPGKSVKYLCGNMVKLIYNLARHTVIYYEYDQYWLLNFFDFFNGLYIRTISPPPKSTLPQSDRRDLFIFDLAVRTTETFMNSSQRLNGFNLTGNKRPPAQKYICIPDGSSGDNLFGIAVETIKTYQDMLVWLDKVRHSTLTYNSFKLLDLALTSQLNTYFDQRFNANEFSTYSLFVVSFLLRNVHYDTINNKDGSFTKTGISLMSYHNLTSVFTLLIDHNTTEVITDIDKNPNSFPLPAYNPKNPDAYNKIRFVNNDGWINIYKELRPGAKITSLSSGEVYVPPREDKKPIISINSYKHVDNTLFYLNDNLDETYLDTIIDHLGVQNVTIQDNKTIYHLNQKSNNPAGRSVNPRYMESAMFSIPDISENVSLFMHNVRVGYGYTPNVTPSPGPKKSTSYPIQIRQLEYTLTDYNVKTYLVFGSSGSGKSTAISQLISSLSMYRKYYIDRIEYTDPTKYQPMAAIENLLSSRTNTKITLKRLDYLEIDTKGGKNTLIMVPTSLSNHVYIGTPYVPQLRKSAGAGPTIRDVEEMLGSFDKLNEQFPGRGLPSFTPYKGNYGRPIETTERLMLRNVYDEAEPMCYACKMEVSSHADEKHDITIYDTMGNEDYYFVTGIKVNNLVEKDSRNPLSPSKSIPSELLIRCESYDILVKSAMLGKHYAQQDNSKIEFTTYDVGLGGLNSIYPSDDFTPVFEKRVTKDFIATTKFERVKGGMYPLDYSGNNPLDVVSGYADNMLKLIPLYSIPTSTCKSLIYNLPLLTSNSSLYLQLLNLLKPAYNRTTKTKPKNPPPYIEYVNQACKRIRDVYIQSCTNEDLDSMPQFNWVTKAPTKPVEKGLIQNFAERTRENVVNFKDILGLYRENPNSTIVALTNPVTKYRDRRFINLILNIAKFTPKQKEDLTKLLSVVNYNSYGVSALMNADYKEVPQDS